MNHDSEKWLDDRISEDVDRMADKRIKELMESEELKDIEIPDLTDQNAFKKVDSAASQSPFSDRLSGAANVGNMDSSVAESKNNLEETTAVKAAQTSSAMDKPSWHND